MNKLYISDLDGTLLNSNIELSTYSIHTINELKKQGLQFTIATARTAASVSRILEPLELDVPVILMNGVIVYDLKSKKYLNINTLPLEHYNTIVDVLEKNNLTGFVYEVKDDKLSTYYETLESSAMKEFHDERVTRYDKVFTKVNSFYDIKSPYIIYFALMDKKEALLPAYEALKDLPGLSLAFYKDIYSKEEIYYLEIFSDKATKYNGVKYLQENYHYDYIIGFGDNLNDLPLFKACNETCAVANAKHELKSVADYIIHSNEEDGVAKFINQHYNIIP
jgi:Cof subfamily protein (haloacid dehalogenase superfamily)